MQATDGDSRVTRVLHRALSAGPRWQGNRAVLGGAVAVVTALAVTGVVALSTSGSATPRAKDAAATTKAKPHYLLPIAALVQDGAVPPPALSGDTGSVGVPTGTVPAPTTPPATPDPNASDITTYRGSTGTMTPAGIATLALERGCTAAQAPVATAVAMAESGGSPSAQGDVTLMTPVWDWSAGLWQIRGLRSERGTGALRDSIANQRATTNAAAMYVISSGCTNWSPWTTYTRGLYLGYLGLARQAVTYVLAYRQKHGHYPAVAAPDPTAVIPVSSGGGADNGNGAAPAPAAAASTSNRPATPAPSRTKTSAPRPQSSATPAAGGGTQQAGGGGGGNAGTTRAPSLPTPAKTTPKITLPKVSVPPVVVPSISGLPLPGITISIPPLGLP